MDIIIIIVVAIYYIYSIGTFEADYIGIDEIKEEKICIGEFGFTNEQKRRHISFILIVAAIFFFLVLIITPVKSTYANMLVVLYLAIILRKFVPIMFLLKWQYLVLTKTKVIGKYKISILGTDKIDLTLDNFTSIDIENRGFYKNISLSVGEIKKILFLNILNAEDFKDAIEKAINSKDKDNKFVESVEEKLEKLEKLKEKNAITEEEYYIERGNILNNI